MIEENFKLTGAIHAVLYDENGNVKDVQDVRNLVMTAGKAYVASRIVGTASPVISNMGVGSGTTAPDVAQTALVTEMARPAATGTSNTNVATYVATFGPGVATGNINECGLFNAATGGTMVARSTSVVLTKGALDTLALTWTITVN